MFNVRAGITGVEMKRSLATMIVAPRSDYRSLVLTRSPGPTQLPLAFLDVRPVSAANIALSDLNESRATLMVQENSYAARRSIFKVTNEFNLSVGGAIITDVLSSPDGGGSPLYFRHDIRDQITGEVTVLTSKRRPVDSSRYRLLVEDGVPVIFHDLEASYSEQTGRAEAFLLEYTNGFALRRTVLLKALPAYSEANVIDGINPSRRTYSVRETASLYAYTIWRNGGGPFYIKASYDHQIKLRPPSLIERSGVWTPEITNGKVTADVGGVRFHYAVNEYHWQSFSPSEPVMFFESRARMVLPKTVVVPRRPLEEPADTHPVDVLVVRGDGVVRAGWTTKNEAGRSWRGTLVDPSVEPTVLNHTLTYTEAVSVEPRSGMIRFPGPTEPGDFILVRGYTRSNTLSYYQLDLNPASNRLMVSGQAVFYCTADEEIGSLGRSIEHFIMDEEGAIADFSDERVGDALDANLLTPDEDESALDKFVALFPTRLIVGSLSINRGLHPDDMLNVDVRTHERLQERVEEAMEAHLYSHPEVRWLSRSSLAGRAMPLMGASVVDIPFSILDEAGGDWSREQVLAAVKEHAPVGTHQVISYYGDYVTLVAAEIVGADLVLTWREEQEMDRYTLVLQGERGTRRNEVRITREASPWEGHAQARLDISANWFSMTAPVILHIEPALNGSDYPWSNALRLDPSLSSYLSQATLDALLEERPSSATTLTALLEL